MVEQGRWRALRPEITRHRGYRISALVSPLAKSWARLAKEVEQVKDDPDRYRVFLNTNLALPYSEEGGAMDENALAARAEPFSLDESRLTWWGSRSAVIVRTIVLKRLLFGWSRSGGCYLLCHEVVHGPIADGDTWAQLDSLLRSRWPHPRGGQLRIAAACIDGSDGGHLTAMCWTSRGHAPRVASWPSRLSPVLRRPIEASKSKMKGGGRLWIVGSNSIKSRIFDQLARGTTIKFSDTLSPVFYEQLASERVVVRQVGGKPVRRFERIKGMAAECLDALVYAWAARARLGLNTAALDQLEEELRSPPGARPHRSHRRQRRPGATLG